MRLVPLLTILLLACNGGDNKDDTSAVVPSDDTGAADDTAGDTAEDTGPFDVDGDGWVAGEDCDDTNAQVNPDMAEVPYDGMDNDCDPSTPDDDLDGDGVGIADDCDDADASVHPGADDTWYDGIDSDCAGNSDNDADGDGVDADGHGGTDCDDHDATISPEQDEAFGDGLDNDCDGQADDKTLDEADSVVMGVDAYALTGGALAGVGDVNGDGYDDVLIGTAGYDDGAESNVGGASLFLGPLAPSADVLDADGTWLGLDDSDYAGGAVAAAGDLNDDGLPDMLVGVRRGSSTSSGLRTGQAWLVFGGAGIAGTSESLATSGVALNGEQANDSAGWSVAGVGDLDLDGHDDVAVGAKDADLATRSDGVSAAGAVYVVAGPATSTTELADGRTIWRGGTAYDMLGWSVAAAGDTDGDGAPELIMGAPGQDSGGSSAGAAYVAEDAGEGSFDASDADITFVGQSAGDYVGRAVASAGDINGDGYDDLLIGAPYRDPVYYDEGTVYVVLGSATLHGSVALSAADALITGSNQYETLGWSVAGAGDLNDDGLDDVIIGAPVTGGARRSSASQGQALIFLGGLSGNLTDADADITLTNEQVNAQGGAIVAGAGDTNADGAADVLVGANYWDGTTDSAGAAFLFLGG